MSNQTYQEIVRQRHFDNFGSQWYVPTEARRHRTDFEVALASQLAPSPEEAAVFGMQDHYGLSEHEQEVRMKMRGYIGSDRIVKAYEKETDNNSLRIYSLYLL